MQKDFSMNIVSTAVDMPVTVTLLLAGGHQYTLPPMEATHPMLKRLFNSLSDPKNDSDSGLFEMLVDQGEQALYFPGKHVIGLFASPPIQLRSRDDNHNADHAASLSYLEIPNVLSPADQEFLFNYVAAQFAWFERVTPNPDTEEYRHALVLSELSNIGELIWRRIQPFLPEVWSQLQLESGSPTLLETELLAHNHGHFSSVHRDNLQPHTTNRQISWLYYFYQDPPLFSGGELLLYDRSPESGDEPVTQPSQAIAPQHNSIIFFPSWCWHALMPVYCSSQAFEHSQFILKGWIGC
jgi:Rps23 Pro-64 3,4-dihydroxylase Tpa1-like proline 4-hydroxylase